MVEYIKRHKYFYSIALSLVCTGFVVLSLLYKGEAVLWFDSNSIPFLDYAFLYITLLGEVVGGALILVALAFYSTKKHILIFALSVLFSLLISQTLKRTIYKEERRPVVTYAELHPIDGLERHRTNSFPSGHTTAAFTFYTALAFGIRKKGIQIIAPIAAAIIGVSRIYLGQHYLNDVVVGAVLGIFITTMVALAVERWKPNLA